MRIFVKTNGSKTIVLDVAHRGSIGESRRKASGKLEYRDVDMHVTFGSKLLREKM